MSRCQVVDMEDWMRSLQLGVADGDPVAHVWVVDNVDLQQVWWYKQLRCIILL